MSSKIKIIIIILLLSSLSLFSGCGCKETTTAYRVDLEVWGLFDDSDAFAEIIRGYREMNPYVGEIKYRKFTQDNYKKELLDAMASGLGPDIFLMHNTWLPGFKDKAEPAPNTIINEQQFRDNFVDVAANDFLDGGKIYTVPLSVDSLAIYYNKDLFNAAGITNPPTTWDEFSADVKTLTKVNQSGGITQAGAAIGTAYNINRSTDLLGMLMLQRGVQMTNDTKTEATFDRPVKYGNSNVRAGEEALNLYTQFARAGSLYTWNPRMHYSIDAFYEGNLAMMINYSWQISTIQSKNSKLNFAVAKIPQTPQGSVANYANYWGFAVSKNKVITPDSSRSSSKLVAYDNNVRVHEAWQFLKFLTMKNGGSVTLKNGISGNVKTFPVTVDPASEYAKKTGKPAARRDIIEQQMNDPLIGPFAYGNLIAKSWYQKEPEATEAILAEMINSVNLGTATSYDALKLAATRVNQLMRK